MTTKTSFPDPSQDNTSHIEMTPGVPMGLISNAFLISSLGTLVCIILIYLGIVETSPRPQSPYFFGFLRPLRTNSICSDRAGILETTFVSPGDFVRKGNVIATLRGLAIRTVSTGLRIEVEDRDSIKASTDGIVSESYFSSNSLSILSKGQPIFDIGTPYEWSIIVNIQKDNVIYFHRGDSACIRSRSDSSVLANGVVQSLEPLGVSEVFKHQTSIDGERYNVIIRLNLLHEDSNLVTSFKSGGNVIVTGRTSGMNPLNRYLAPRFPR